MPRAETMMASLILLLSSASAVAQDAATASHQPQPGYGFAPTVGALLRADADKALAQALGKSRPQTAPDAGAGTTRPSAQAADQPLRSDDRTTLIGIYGQAQAWRADVVINGVAVPLSAGDRYQSWQVRAINGRCVELGRTTGKAVRTLCLAR